MGDEGGWGEDGWGVLDMGMSVSSSWMGSVSEGFEGENLMAIRRRRLVMLSLKTRSSCVGPNSETLAGLLVHIASPSPFVPRSFSTSAFAVAKARFMREVKTSGILGRGSVVAAPPEKEEFQPSLSPGTKMKVEDWRRVGYSKRVRARLSKYSLYSMLPPLPPRDMMGCWTKFPMRMNVIGVFSSVSEA